MCIIMRMLVLEKVSLKDYSTMRLGGIADYLCEVETKKDVTDCLSWAQEHKLPFVMVGGGSNIIWQNQGFKGLVLINKIKGFELFKED